MYAFNGRKALSCDLLKSDGYIADFILSRIR